MNPELFIAKWRQESLPLIAILRGIKPEEATTAADILINAGFRWLEVPLNSPSALESIHLLRQHTSWRALIGAGTVLTAEQVDQVAESGGQMIISPNCDPAVIRRSRAKGLINLPGVMTPSEAFTAIAAGASALKLFPAEQLTPVLLKAYRAVIPPHVACLPVGGIQPDAQQMRRYLLAGANGFGLGSGLYQSGMSMDVLRERAEAYQQAWHAVTAL